MSTAVCVPLYSAVVGHRTWSAHGSRCAPRLAALAAQRSHTHDVTMWTSHRPPSCHTSDLIPVRTDGYRTVAAQIDATTHRIHTHTVTVGVCSRWTAPRDTATAIARSALHCLFTPSHAQQRGHVAMRGAPERCTFDACVPFQRTPPPSLISAGHLQGTATPRAGARLTPVENPRPPPRAHMTAAPARLRRSRGSVRGL